MFIFSCSDILNNPEYYDEKDIKGEFVVLVEGKEKSKDDIVSELSIEELMEQYLEEGLDKKEAMKKVAKDKGITKSEVYKYLLKNDLVHFLATDTHRKNTIYPLLKKATKKIEKIIGKEKTEELIKINPQKILNNT